MKYIHASAEISRCGQYRYFLQRTWRRDAGPVVFCMLNPSTADGHLDDATIRRCVAFADSWGYGTLGVVNLFAYRATYPSDMLAAEDPVGPENDRRIADACKGHVVVCAWGATVLRAPLMCPGRVEALSNRPLEVGKIIRSAGGKMRHLGLTAGGHPKHPVRLSADSMLMTFQEAT